IDNAIALARKYKYSLRIVTLEGELLSAGGSMTGGAFKNTSNLLGRRREIEELEESCKKALIQVESIQGDINIQEGILQEKKEELEAGRGAVQKLYLEQNTLRLNLAQLEEKKAEIAGSYMDLERERGQLDEQVREISASQETLKQETAVLEEKHTLSGQAVEEKTAALEAARESRETCAAELAQIQLEAAGLQQQLAFLQEHMDRVRGEMRRLQAEYRELEDGDRSSQDVIAARRQEIASLKERIAAIAVHTQELEAHLTARTAKKEEMSGRQKGFFIRREELSARMSDLDKDMFRLQSQQEKLEERLEHSTTYMWNEYEMTFSSAEALRDQNCGSLAEIRRQIDDLKGRIKALGNVNVNAIEDYREVSERYEFMKTQHGDLVAAQAELEKIIVELDTGMRRQFQEKFGEIRAEFDKVFKELFGGGRGALELMEDEDILEAGIQIIAQPPGKKLQNMMQLSGGEKALTAISLLFPIQNLKPSPFCLLDEIEAALDDSNVDRFAGYLHKLTRNTQFIVITHRRGTMVSADRLYGITMQEKGVSTLVSVNLIEDDLDK
ncbi:MAG: AAA family ATPase, partial [Clostridium sp.]|nr:AAA family ATPase [Clostridium sp.]